jgi:peptidyl-prolyl cis-trans isomerase B (cyclophilin B)
MEDKKSKEPDKKTNILAIISLFCAFIFPLLGLIFGLIAKNQIKKTGEKGEDIAIIAIAVSLSVGLLIFIAISASTAYFVIFD